MVLKIAAAFRIASIGAVVLFFPTSTQIAPAQEAEATVAGPTPIPITAIPAPIPFEAMVPLATPVPSPASILPANTQTVVEPSNADLIPWRYHDYSMMVQGRDISQFLPEFGRLHGIKVVVSPNVTGQVNGKFENIPPGKLLDQLAQAYNFSWFYSAGVLFVSSDNELKTEVVNLSSSNAEAAARNLNELGLITSNGAVQVVPGSKIVIISGPPQFVQIARQILEAVHTEDEYRLKTESIIEVFPLTHAWAYDIDLGGNAGESGKIEGVATTLSRLLGTGGHSNVPARDFSTYGVARQMQGAIDTSNPASPTIIVNGNGQPGQGREPEAPEPGQGARITADVRRNAVVIRDVRENMQFYRDAIAKLDVPVKIVEISAAIVDLKIGFSRSLGLNTVAATMSGRGTGLASSTGALTGNNQSTTTTNGNGNGTSTPQLPTTNLAPTSGPQPNIIATGVFGTLQVTAAINALEQDNVAKVLSRPTVMTLDNYGAVISRQETFFVNTTGQYVSNLFNVTSGLNLQVVPHVIADGGVPKVYMQVKIEDGSLSNDATSSIPRVQQSALTTQSVIHRDQSLLIGGLYIKVDQKQRSGYPWLHNIPVVGYLFGVKGRSEDMVERLFLITPRIVDLHSNQLGDYSKYFQPGPLQEEAIRRAEPVDPKNIQVYPAPAPPKARSTPNKAPFR